MDKKKLKQAKQRPAGFNCPQCNFFIEVSIESLLYGPDPQCPQCLTKYTMNRSESSGEFNFLQKNNDE